MILSNSIDRNFKSMSIVIVKININIFFLCISLQHLWATIIKWSCKWGTGFETFFLLDYFWETIVNINDLF